MQAQEVIDRMTINELKESMGADFVAELIDTYNTETAELIKMLCLALVDRDAVAFGRHAHSIKSSSASLGALAFSQQARELEMMGKTNDLTNADQKVKQLAADFLQVRSTLEGLRHGP